MKLRQILLLSALLSVGIAIGAETLKTKDFSVKLIPSRAVNVDDQFVGILPQRPPQLPIATCVVVDEPFKVNIIFLNATAKDHAFALAGQLTMTDPAGKKTEIPLSSEKLKMKISGDPQGVFLLPQELGVVLEATDRQGEYRFDIVLQDVNGNRSAKHSASVKLVDKIEPKKGEAAFAKLECNYQSPAPEYIIPAFREFLNNLPTQKEREKQNFNPLPQLGFFYFLLKDNPQVVKPFAEMVKSLNGEEKHLGSVALYFAVPDRHELIDKEMRQAINRQFPADPFVIDQAVLPWHLDICWAEFLVRGTRAPVLKVVQALGLVNDAMTIEQFKKIAEPTDEDKRKLLNGLTVMAAQWSLKSLAEKHPLIRYYVEAALIRKEITAPAAILMAAKAIGMKVNTSNE